jgi:hypothetical protein
MACGGRKKKTLKTTSSSINEDFIIWRDAA